MITRLLLSYCSAVVVVFFAVRIIYQYSNVTCVRNILINLWIVFQLSDLVWNTQAKKVNVILLHFLVLFLFFGFLVSPLSD